MTSTARKFGRAWLRRLIWIFIRLNLALLILAALTFCYVNERGVLGADWTWDIPREASMPAFERDGIRTPLNAMRAFEDAYYVFYDAEGDGHSMPTVRAFLALAGIPFGVLLAVELLFLIEQAASGRRVARRLLKPLDRMARAARELGRSASRERSAEREPAADSGEKLNDLQSAIRRINPDHPEERLHMGDRDLAGLEEAINGLLERMREAYAQQTQFVSDASHELRTPIAVIQGYANLLDRWGKQDQKVLDESVSAIRSEADYMHRLVEQLLFLARGDAGRNPMERQRVDLGELMKEACEDGQLIDPAHDWRVDAQPGAVCMGDKDLLKQCARILTDNARKYTPEGGLILLKAYAAPTGEVCMQVQDSGRGIDREDMPKVFDRFYRSDPARDRSGGGAGLGLSIARWIVERHGGHFELLSRQGIGTRMCVLLPAAQEGGPNVSD